MFIEQYIDGVVKCARDFIEINVIVMRSENKKEKK